MKSKVSVFWIVGLLILISAGTWYFYYKSAFVGLAYNDAMDYASMGRNIADGRGIMSSYITPLGLAHKGVPQPDLWRAPGWPLVLSIFIKFFGPTDQAIALACGMFFIGAVPLLFLFTRYWFGTTLAIFSVLIYTFSSQNLQFSISGLTEPMALFMLITTVFVLCMPYFRNSWGDLLLGGINGLFYLTRYNALPFLPAILLFRLYSRKTEHNDLFLKEIFKTMLVWAMGFLAIAGPWFWRNYQLMRDPFFSLQKYEPVMFTKTYPGYSLYTMFEKVNSTQFILHNWPQIWLKIGQNWNSFVTDLLSPVFTGLSPVLFVLFLLSCLFAFHEKQKGIRLVLASGFVLQLAALLVIHYIPRLFFMFMPFYVIYGLALVRKMGLKYFKNKSIASFAVLLVTLVAILTNLPAWHSKNIIKPLNRELSSSIREVSYRTSRNDLIISNDGHVFAWYADRNAAKLPYSTRLLTEMDRYAKIKLIHLSPRVSWNIPEADDSWRKVYWGKPKEFNGFRLLKVLPDKSLLYGK